MVLSVKLKEFDANTTDPEGPHHHHQHQHYIEHHGTNPDWTGPTDLDEEDNKKIRHGCCQNHKGQDTRYRLQEIKLPWWVVFLARFSLIWELILYLMTVATFGLVTFYAFFAFFEHFLSNATYVMDFIFNCDIMMRLLVEIWRYRNQVGVVIFTVPYSMFQFLLDLITIVPFHQIYIWIWGTHYLDNLSMLDYWRFNKFIRLYRSYIFFRTLQEERRANEKMLFLIRFTNYYIGFIHLTSCLLMYLVGVEPLDFLLMRNRDHLDKTWMRVVNKKKIGYPTEKPGQTYALATNLATATVTTVGYGDLSATNEVEMVWCIFFMLFGAIFLNGYFTSQLTTFELETDGARFDLFFRVSEIMKYLKTVGTLPLFNAKVEEYYKSLWSYREGVYEVQFMLRLPLAFQEDLLFDICQEMFDKSFLFNGMDEALLRAIAKIVKVDLYNSDMILCRKGGYANKLYYILQGECIVMSRFMNKPAAILRAGSIIGEANLFFSFPYTATIETRTTCQFIILEKEELIIAMDGFRDQLCLLRAKSQAKVAKLYEMHEIYGVEPICWVAAKTNLDNPSEPKASYIKLTMRWGSGRNREVIEDVIDDTKDCVIFDTPCEKKDVVKNHLTPYITCAVPEIMDTKYSWIHYWNVTMMIISMVYAFMGPYCVSFGENSESERTMCFLLTLIGYPLTLLNIMDVFVEIIAAAPVYGLYYQFWDGIKVKKYEPMFYFDILAALPLGFSTNMQDKLKMFDIFCKSFKLWKVLRYLHFLDNRYPLQLFWFRLAQTILVLMYGIHFIACINYMLACPEAEGGGGQNCSTSSWLYSYERAYENDDSNHGKKAPRWMRMETLRDSAPYLYSFFYSSATLTSAGFGDFNPQNGKEMFWAIGFQLFGFYLIGYYTSTLTSALSCVVRPKLVFQQKLISIKQFITENHLKEVLRDRIIEYFHLQNQLRGGVTLSRGICHMMYDTPEYLRNDVLYLEVVELIEGIPVFSKVEADVIIKMSSQMKRFLIPPNTTFLHKGEIRRVMYLIKQGSVGIFGDNSENPVNILEASSHFGIRDLLFGEPCHFTMKSLSHVYLYSIKIDQVQEAMQQDEEFWEFVNKEREKLTDSIDEMIKIYSQMVRRTSTSAKTDLASVIPSWINLPKKPSKELIEAVESNQRISVDAKNVYIQNQEYDQLFSHVRFGKIWKQFLMRKTVHPAGLFASTWTCILSVSSFLMVMFMCIETFVWFRRPGFRICQWILDCLSIVDIYVKMHWAYFNIKKDGSSTFITHPLKTSLNYIMNGTFVMDVLACTPLEMIIPLLGWTDFFGYGEGATWYTKLRWTRILQIKRLFTVYEIAHTIFKHRNAVLLTVYVITTLFLCTLLGSICLFTACPWEASVWKTGDEYRMPICLERGNMEDAPDYWSTIKSGDAQLISGAMDRWTLSIYYVSQVVLVIGFGDLITLRRADILMLIFMQVFGFIFMRCVIADVTAAEVDSDEIRANFLEGVEILRLVMLRESVPKRLMKTVLDHLLNTWEKSKGLQPRDLFQDLHPALESDVFRELVSKELASVPLLHGFTANILRTISGFLKKIYFRRGERIMRCGNLEYEMCIIIRGKVFICDMHYNYICTLSKGDCFGEAAMINNTRRCYNAVAMNNVELYFMTAANFGLVLERYPTVKDQLQKKLGADGRDYFEQGLSEKILLVKGMNNEQQMGLIKSFMVRTQMTKTALSLREDLGEIQAQLPWYHWSKWFGNGVQDEDLPFLYFAKGRYRNIGNTFAILVHPNCRFMKIYTYILVWFSYVTSGIATYETSFIGASGTDSDALLDTASDEVIKVSRYIEILYLVNLFLKFITPFEVADGIYCKTYRGIITKYVTDPTKFLVDLIGCVPYIVDELIVTNQQLQASDLKYIYLLKIVRLVRYYEYNLARKNNLSISTFRYKITISVSSFCLMAHMLACVFYNISPCVTKDTSDLCPKGETDTWTTVFKDGNDMLNNPSDFEQWKWWVRSLYWVVTTVSTTGFGDILPYTVHEMGVAVVCIFCGAFILSVILSDFTSGMASITKANREYMYQVQLLVKHLRNIGLSQTRQDQVMMYFLMMWNRCRDTSYDKATAIIPVCLQIEVCNALFGSCLKTVPYFRGHDEDSFIRQLSLRVKHSIFIPGVCIVNEGDQGSSMFVVFKGLVSATKLPESDIPDDKKDDEEDLNPNPDVDTSNSNKKPYEFPTLVNVYNVGDVFGRYPALFRDEAYRKSYRAESRVEVLEIQQADIEHLTKKFPYFYRNMMHLIQMRYSDEGLCQHIFSNVKKNKENLFDLGEDYKAPQQLQPQKKKRRDSKDETEHLDLKDKEHKSGQSGHGSMDKSDHKKLLVKRNSRHSKILAKEGSLENITPGDSISFYVAYRKSGKSLEIPAVNKVRHKLISEVRSPSHHSGQPISVPEIVISAPDTVHKDENNSSTKKHDYLTVPDAQNDPEPIQGTSGQTKSVKGKKRASKSKAVVGKQGQPKPGTAPGQKSKVNQSTKAIGTSVVSTAKTVGKGKGPPKKPK